MSSQDSGIKIRRSDAEKLDISKLKNELKDNANATNETLNNYKSMQLENSNDSNKGDEGTINIRRSDKLTHDVRELSSKR